MYRIFNKNGNPGPFHTFVWPTMFLCRPSLVEKAKDLQLEGSTSPSDYRLLHFKKDDQLVTRVHTDQDIDNVSEVMLEDGNWIRIKDVKIGDRLVGDGAIEVVTNIVEHESQIRIFVEEVA